MSARDQEDRLPPDPEIGEDDYADDLNLDLELERVIKHLDEATSERSPTILPPEPRPRPPEPPARPSLSARAPVPARDPKPGSASADTVLLTERLEPLRSGKSEVLELVDEIDYPPAL
jgi:hypothetical protein